MSSIANSLGHIKDVHIEHGPPEKKKTLDTNHDQSLNRGFSSTFKKKVKKKSPSRVLIMEDGQTPNSRGQSPNRLKVVQQDSIGGGFNASKIGGKK